MRHAARQSWLLSFFLIAGWLVAGPLQAQVGERRTPSVTYYRCFAPFYDGEYADALRCFQDELRGAIKTTQSRWIDSICYETMCGECYYQMGELDKALQHYTNALELYRRFPDWMLKVRFLPALRPAGVSARKAVPWGATKRRSAIGAFPASELLGQGQIDITDTVRRGGIVQQANLFPVTPHEIVRCTALALRRRAELLGPVAKHDPLSSDVLAALNRPVGPPNHWSECWVDVERGLALIAAGRPEQAPPLLEKGVLAAGEYDHPLTAVALFELGKLALARGDYPTALQFFEETTYAAVNVYSASPYWPDYGILEEAFRFGTVTHLLANRKGFFAPLEPAIAWAKRSQLRQLQASLLLLAAENQAVLGNTAQAVRLLDEARAAIGRRKMGAGWIGARLNHLLALTSYQQQRPAEGDAALNAALSYMRHGSVRLLQMRLADELYVSGAATARSALELYEKVLRDPTPADWAFDPLESLAVTVAPRHMQMEHWFEAALERQGIKEVQGAIEIAERLRRHRFLNSLDLGGRLTALRWLLEAEPALLPQSALLQRQDLLARYPAYEQLSRRAKALCESLGKLPLLAEEPKLVQEQSQALAELASVSGQQEVILREIAVRREAADTVFPPLMTVADIQKALPEKHAVLAFFSTARGLYAFLLNNERYACWKVAAPQMLLKNMQTLLREIGNYGQNHELSLKDLAEEKWRRTAEQSAVALEKDSPLDLSQPLEELTIVPDGWLWYFPFEVLQKEIEGEPRSLISRFRLRYAPTLSLTAWPATGRAPSGVTGVVVGRLYPRDDAAIAQTAFERLSKVVPGAATLPPLLPGPSAVYRTMLTRLVVFDDLQFSETEPYDWTPLPGSNKAGGRLSDWLRLPLGGPQVVCLPGFHSAAEDALKRVRGQTAGGEIFLAVCGLLGSGSRTVLLSRWRTGGGTSFDLTREFVQELSRTSPADAWRRAVLLTMDAKLDLETEPRLKRAAVDEPPRASHPFFWAGYMLVDCGPPPAKHEPLPAEAAPELPQPNPPPTEPQPAEEHQPENNPSAP